MICARCDMPIRPGEASRKDIEPGTTGAGGNFYVHEKRCKRAQVQTAPKTRQQ